MSNITSKLNTKISLRYINKSYKDNQILNNINIDFEESKLYVLMGKSGSGKSTLLNIIGLLDKPTSGDVFINNRPVNKLNDNKKSTLRMKDIGFVFQSYFLHPKMKAYENVMIPMYINSNYKNVDIKKRALKLLKLFGLENKYNMYPNELSGGEQQRVAIARAISNDASIIIADEPTGNLDKENEKIVLECFKKLVDEGKTVIIVTHNESLLKYADKSYYLHEGRLEEL